MFVYFYRNLFLVSEIILILFIVKIFKKLILCCCNRVNYDGNLIIKINYIYFLVI